LKMNIDDLKDRLRRWLRLDTWDTGHPLDERRFNAALETVSDTIGVGISRADFKRAMAELALEYHPDWLEKQRNKSVEEFAARAADFSK
jgi:hypothetical protein